MKHKDLYEYVRQEIINELIESGTKTFIASSSSDEEAALNADSSISSTNKQSAAKALKASKPGAAVVVPTNELARNAAVITVGDSKKVQLAKEIYEGSDIEKIIDLVVNAGEEGITQEKISEILGIRFNELTQNIKDLTKIGAFSKPQKSIDNEPTPKEPKIDYKSVDKDEWEQDEEEPAKDEWEKPEEEPEEEKPTPELPTISKDEDTEKIIGGKAHGEKLSPEDEVKFIRISGGINTKIARLEELPKNERIDSPDYPVLVKLLANKDIKKLYKDKGIDLPTIPSVIVK
jgi:hypothetical protein